MDTSTAIAQKILKLCKKYNLSLNKLATICQMPPSTIKNILYGKSQNVKIGTIIKICDGLEISLLEFF